MEARQDGQRWLREQIAWQARLEELRELHWRQRHEDQSAIDERDAA